MGPGTPAHTPAAPPTDPPHPPSTEQLRAYVAQGLGPHQIVKTTRCPPPLISRLLVQAGLARPATRDVLATLDPAWLRHEYEHKRRSLHDIAGELGIHGKDLSVHAHSIGIHTQRGARGRHVLGAHGGPDAFPPTVWAAFTGFQAEQRIRRLLATSGHTSLNQAARALGTKQPSLTAQIRRLEHAVGAELLHHGPEHSTITLTAAGEQFARDVQPALALLDEHRGHDDRSTAHT
ncbi:helix-turn-helix domain-containing protein [Protofrankia symbiont of Coriaria ruscifolia]|uniref:helix-turn-helix domain-containing protein n=1 Tax=Protofrankia symbiont of Coriaria ruscifolia TaxID=1306542 RepID=UPI00104156ED|nr:LysR family transcriptional regulator [Protofrankia symbiont of Coriaria ruscifolia]